MSSKYPQFYFCIGGEKLGITCVKAVLETDGTEIDEDYMECLENNTVLLLLQENEAWEEKGTLHALCRG